MTTNDKTRHDLDDALLGDKLPDSRKTPNVVVSGARERHQERER